MVPWYAGDLPRLDGKAKCASQHQNQEHQQQVLCTCIHAPGPTLVVRCVTKMVVQLLVLVLADCLWSQAGGCLNVLSYG